MPEVLYLDSAECRIIVTFSVLSLLTNIAPYSTLVGCATVHYKRTMADNGIAVNFLQCFRVLFFRYKPAYF